MFNTLRRICILAFILTLSGFVATSVSAQFSQYASGWTASPSGGPTPGVDWFPLPPSSNPLGPPDASCVGSTNAPTVWAQFSFPGLGIPGGETVVGIEVNVNYGSVVASTLELYMGGSMTGSSRALGSTPPAPTCNASVIRTAGGAADLWGTSLTAADFNAGTVEVRLTRTTAGPDNPVSIDIESIELVVYTSGGNSDPDCSGAAIAVQIADAACQATISGSDVTGVTDPDGDPLTITVNPTTLALGSNNVTVMADDGNGGTCSEDITVNVIDVTDPVITCPADASLDADALTCQAGYAGPPATATDNCSVNVTSNPALPATFSGPGSNPIAYTATDGSGNTAMCTQTITVNDVTPPVITLNGANPLTLECGVETYVEPGATAVDACAGSVPVTPSGTVDESTPGTYTITYTAADGNGNTGTEERDVEVDDTLPPEVTAELIFVPGDDDDDDGGYEVQCTATDICDDDPTVTSVIVTPTLTNPTIKFKTKNRKRLLFKLGRNQIIVQGPDPAAFWAEVQANGGVEVVNGQGLALGGDDDDDDGGNVLYRFNNQGELKSVEGGDPAVLRCTAMDDSGNTATDEATPPLPPGDDDDDGGDDDDDDDRVAEVGAPVEGLEAEAEAAAKAAAEAAAETEGQVEIPDDYELAGNYPNPFNPETRIRFGVPEDVHVKLTVFDMLGRRVRVLVDGVRKAGMHEAVFDAATLPSGTYLYRLETPRGSFVGSMLLVK